MPQKILASATSLVNPTGQVILTDVRGRAHPAGKVVVSKGHAAQARKVALADARDRVTPLGTVTLASAGPLGKPAGKLTLASAASGLTAPVVPAVLRGVRSGDYCPLSSNRVTNLLWKLGARPPIILAWGNEQQCFDFVTYGGFFFGSSDGLGMVNFGGNAGYKNGPPPPLMVHVNVVDHNLGRHISIQAPLSSTSYAPASDFGTVCQCRRFQGTGTSTNLGMTSSVTADVEVCDKGEPGNAPKGSDVFWISLSDGYSALGNPIIGGNVQLHKQCRQAGC
jgi:hypothetical protein